MTAGNPLHQIDETPDTDEYQQLRIVCGLSAKTTEAAKKGLPNSLYCTTIRDRGKLIVAG